MSARGVEERPVADRDAARVGLLEPGDAAQQRGLAAARGAEQRHHLAARQREGDALEDLVLAELHAHIFDDEISHGRAPRAQGDGEPNAIMSDVDHGERRDDVDGAGRPRARP